MFGSVKHFLHRAAHYLSPVTAIQQTERAAHQVSRSTSQAVHFQERAAKDAGQYTERSSRSLTQYAADVTVRIEKVVVPALAVIASILTEGLGGIGGEAVAALGALNARVAGGVEARRRGMHGLDARDFARKQERETGLYAATAAGLASLAFGVVSIASSLFAPATAGAEAVPAELAGEAGNLNNVSLAEPLTVSAAPPEALNITGDALPTLKAAPEVAPLGETVSIANAGQDVIPTVAASSGGGFWNTALGIGEKLVGPAVNYLLPKKATPAAPVGSPALVPGGASGGSAGGGGTDPGLLGDIVDGLKNASPLGKAALAVGGAVVAGLIVNSLSDKRKG